MLTGMRSAYFWRIRSASALRFSKGCSSLNLERMIAGLLDRLWVTVSDGYGAGAYKVGGLEKTEMRGGRLERRVEVGRKWDGDGDSGGERERGRRWLGRRPRG